MDLLTLHVEHAVLLGLFTLLTLLNCRLHSGARGGYWFPAYMLCAFSGAVLLALHDLGMRELPWILVGTAFFHLAYLCLHIGLQDFFRRPGRHNGAVLVQGGAVAFGICGIVEYGLVQPNPALRTVFFSLVVAFQTSLLAAVLFRKSRGQLAVPGRLMGMLLATLAADNVVRAALALHFGVSSGNVTLLLATQLSVLETTVLQGGITVGFVWMTAAVLHERLDHLASTDSLTGLLNRRALESAAQQEIEVCRARRTPLTAVLMDLDGFKQINDSFGHAFGDHVLLQVSQCMQEHMRKSDLLARIGGDEFAVLLHDTSRAEAQEITERLRCSIEDLIVRDQGCEARVRASFGIAEIDGSVRNWVELVRRCDSAVYRAKGIGGNLAAAH